MNHRAADNRYESMRYNRTGQSGLKLPAISLGLWHNFGDSINHFYLANNYGPPYGSAEVNFGRLLREDFKAHRDELVISTKAGWDMWPGPYGKGGG